MKNTDKQTGKTAARDKRGRFLPGNAGGGRPPGSANALLKRAREGAALALERLIEAVQGGDLDAAKAVCSFGIPKLRPVEMPVAVNLPECDNMRDFRKSLLDLVREGAISIDNAARLMEIAQDGGEAGEQVITIERSYMKERGERIRHED